MCPVDDKVKYFKTPQGSSGHVSCQKSHQQPHYVLGSFCLGPVTLRRGANHYWCCVCGFYLAVQDLPGHLASGTHTSNKQGPAGEQQILQGAEGQESTSSPFLRVD